MRDGKTPIPLPIRKGVVLIPGSETPQRHVMTAFETVVSQSEGFRRGNVLVACHSWGGVSVCSLLRHKTLGPSTRRSVRAVAFIDSVHRHPEPPDASRRLFVCDPHTGNEQQQTQPSSTTNTNLRGRTLTETDLFLKTKCRSWKKSPLTLDRALPIGRDVQGGIPSFSAGTKDHDRCPSSTRVSVLRFFRGALSHPSPGGDDTTTARKKVRWQFRDTQVRDGWKDYASDDAIMIERAFVSKAPRLRLSNRFGTYVVSLGHDPSKWYQVAMRTSRRRGIRRVVI